MAIGNETTRQVSLTASRRSVPEGLEVICAGTFESGLSNLSFRFCRQWIPNPPKADA
jgi:hypothetical protein